MKRVWTKDFRMKYTCWTDWMTVAQCKNWIINRYGHWPPFAYISSAQTTDAFIDANGE